VGEGKWWVVWWRFNGFLSYLANMVSVIWDVSSYGTLFSLSGTFNWYCWKHIFT
jgi:hypothetical protein